MFERCTALHDLRRGLVQYQRRGRTAAGRSRRTGVKLNRPVTGHVLLSEVGWLKARSSTPPGRRVKDSATHGMKAAGIAGPDVGPQSRLQHSECDDAQSERARRLRERPKRPLRLVDAGAAVWDVRGRRRSTAAVIVVEKATETTMMAALLRFVSVNPYWNTPPDFAQKNVAPHVLKEGLTYLTDRDYQVLSDWTDDATQIDPATVDWASVAAGKANVRLRRGPGPWNSMGEMKFRCPRFGIPTPCGRLEGGVQRRPMDRTADRWRMRRFANGWRRVRKAGRSKVEENVELTNPGAATYLLTTRGANGASSAGSVQSRSPCSHATRHGRSRSGDSYPDVLIRRTTSNVA